MKLAVLSVFCLLMLCAESAVAQNRVTASITVTNKTTNGMTFVVNGNTRTFTNLALNPASQVLTNADVTGCGSATNLLSQIYAAPFSQIVPHAAGTNSFTLVGNSGVAMIVTASAGWASVSYSTQAVSTLVAVRVPVAGEATADARTNIASGVVAIVNAPENTNSISQTSRAASQLVGTNNTQTISGKTLLNPILVSPSSTNGINYGNAFSSPNTNGLGGEQLGNSASASGEISSAFGSAAVSSGLASVAIGSQAHAIDDNGTAVGTGSFAGGSGAVAIGASSIATNSSTAVGGGALANANTSTALGASTSATNVNSTAIGFGASTTADNQIMLGGSGINAVVQNGLYVGNSQFIGQNLVVTGNGSILGIQTNANLQGKTILSGADISFVRFPVTSLANGNNAAVPVGTNVFIEVSGPTGAFTLNGIAGGRDGKLIVIVNQTGFDMTIAHQSGTDPTAANRIISMTGADRTTTGNGTATLIYSGSASRWLLINFDP